MYRCVCLLVFIGVSLSVSMMQYLSPDRFQLMRSQYRRSDSCNICYGNECLPFDQDRCDYYAEANDMLQKEEEDPTRFQDQQLKEDVDSIMYDIVEKANQASDIECIPYVSRYTDCDKETVCIGCKTCQCDSEGKWKCTLLSECRFQEPAIDINHQILVTVVDNMFNNVKSSRRKRSKNESQLEILKSTITPEEINEWLYEIKPSEKESPIHKEEITPSNKTQGNDPKSLMDNAIKNDVKPLIEHSLTSSTTDLTIDTDYLAFDDVLNNIAVDTKTYTRKKPPPQVIDEETLDFDYMLAERDTLTKQYSNTQNNVNVTEIYVNVEAKNGVTESNTDDATKVFIDLLESVKNNNLFNDTGYMDIIGYKKDLFVFDQANNVVDRNALDIIKRQAVTVSNKTQAVNATATTTTVTPLNNVTGNILNDNYLKDKVLLPIVKIVNNKDKDTEELKNIKQNLINFMKTHNQSPVVEILDYPNISEGNNLHEIEMFPDLAFERRRSDSDVLELVLRKLKADIYEVTKDIMNIKKYKQIEIPEELANLIATLQKYIKKDRPLKNSDQIETVNNFTMLTRRRGESNNNKCPDRTFNECIVEILQTVDNDLRIGNAIPALSPFSRRIIRNIVQTYYIDDISAVRMKVHGPTYNITNDLKSLGSKWQDLTHKIIAKSPFVTLYRMKLVYLFLKLDINKINDALIIVDFALNRRMIPYFNDVPNTIIDNINKEVKSMYNEMQVIVQNHSKYPNNIKNILTSGAGFGEVDKVKTTANLTEKQRFKKKNSFIERIRNLLKSSKADVDVKDQKSTKSEYVKQVALKKLNRLARRRYLEFEESMKKWQKTLGLLPQSRSKRDLTGKLGNRIKNIIPKYLRHKVNPKLNKKKKAKTNQLDNKNDKKKIHGNERHKKTTLTTATTPKTEPTTTARHTKSPRKSHKTSAIKTIINKTTSHF